MLRERAFGGASGNTRGSDCAEEGSHDKGTSDSSGSDLPVGMVTGSERVRDNKLPLTTEDTAADSSCGWGSGTERLDV